MATGVKPRDEETTITRSDLEAIEEAMKNKKFRDLLVDYCEEVRDPANQALYQKEMTQLEKERGFDITFINPKSGYVIKTSVAGDRKAYINICSNENIGKPSYTVQEVNGQRGMNWQIPYSLIPPREDLDSNRKRIIIYDVVFHPDTVRMAEVNQRFREVVNKTAFEGLENTYNIHLDSNNFRFPKSNYKGMVTPGVIRKEDPHYKPPTEDDGEHIPSDILDKLYPQHSYTENPKPTEKPHNEKKKELRARKANAEFTHGTDGGYTIPKYVIKQQKNVDFQDFTYHKDCKQYSAIPSHIIVEINLPMLSSTKDCILDVFKKSLNLKSEKPAKYKLNITLPYPVNDECGSATFDKAKHLLIVTLPVIRKDVSCTNMNSFKVDSGVESEETSGSQSDDDISKDNIIQELSSLPTEKVVSEAKISSEENSFSTKSSFLENCHSYILPSYTHNVLDDIIAFTFHVKNTEPDSVKVHKDGNNIWIKFTSVGSGYVPVHYAAIIVFNQHVKFENVTGEAWDNNVILQLEFLGDAPQNFQIGLNIESMVYESLDISQVKRSAKEEFSEIIEGPEKPASPIVEVTNQGSETNIVVSTNHVEYDEDDDIESSTSNDISIVWTETNCCENGAKSILRKPIRSYSESSMGDVASSMDYISSDCIPEESSLKKTVRFNDVIARQFYRYNSSIEGQKKKNQRKKTKRRNQERNKSESEAEDDITNLMKSSKPRLKSVLKQRRDSGLADTSDAEADYNKNSLESNLYGDMDSDMNYDGNTNLEDEDSSVFNIVNNTETEKCSLKPNNWELKLNTQIQSRPKQTERKSDKTITCDNIKHNTKMYNPDKLNKGQYLEVTFKNDLIFDLDM